MTRWSRALGAREFAARGRANEVCAVGGVVHDALQELVGRTRAVLVAQGARHDEERERHVCRVAAGLDHAVSDLASTPFLLHTFCVVHRVNK